MHAEIISLFFQIGCILVVRSVFLYVTGIWQDFLVLNIITASLLLSLLLLGAVCSFFCFRICSWTLHERAIDKNKSKKQKWKAVSCIILLYTLSWPKWKPAAHLVACKISYRRGKKITQTHTHTGMHNFFSLLSQSSERETHICCSLGSLSRNAPKNAQFNTNSSGSH